jgi:hypothetical protein
MAIEVIGTLKPKNNGNFPVAEAMDIGTDKNGTRLNAVLAALQAAIEKIQQDIENTTPGGTPGNVLASNVQIDEVDMTLDVFVTRVTQSLFDLATAVDSIRPNVTEEDNGKVPQVVDGAFAYIDVANLKMSDGRTLTTYIADLINEAIGGGFVPPEPPEPDEPDEPDTASGYLISNDGYILTDINGIYLKPKESV